MVLSSELDSSDFEWPVFFALFFVIISLDVPTFIPSNALNWFKEHHLQAISLIRYFFS
jgi:hypothetical protein